MFSIRGGGGGGGGRQRKEMLHAYFLLLLLLVSGLDPAGPLFEKSLHALNKGNAEFVDVIHTDARPFGMTNDFLRLNTLLYFERYGYWLKSITSL